MFKWQIPVLMLSCRFRKFISQIVGKTFKVNAWVGFVKKEIRFRSIRNSTNKQNDRGKFKFVNLSFRYVTHFRC